MVNSERDEVLKNLKGYAKMSLDITFKRVFGNEDNKGALIAFLNRAGLQFKTSLIALGFSSGS